MAEEKSWKSVHYVSGTWPVYEGDEPFDWAWRKPHSSSVFFVSFSLVLSLSLFLPSFLFSDFLSPVVPSTRLEQLVKTVSAEEGKLGPHWGRFWYRYPAWRWNGRDDFHVNFYAVEELLWWVLLLVRISTVLWGWEMKCCLCFVVG